MSTFVIGDLHGHFHDYRRLMQSAGLADAQGHWCGGTHHLWLIGDLFDRGINGVDCVAWTMALQTEARAAGGDVNVLLGNHEMMLLCAVRFGDAVTSAGMRVIDQWIMWGGVESDLERLDNEQVDWLGQLPAMALEGEHLLIHADAMFYVEYGRTVDQVNKALADLLASDELHRWENTLRSFAEHKAFCSLGMTGQQRASRMLQYFGGRHLVHGHTPIPFATGQAAETVDEAWTYAGGLCTNVDGGLYLGSPGFVYELPVSNPQD